MNYDFIRLHRFRLAKAARNEGKLKSFESCLDVRAWSHDPWLRDRYLRDWMKYNMPICVIPVCTLASILSVMACRSRGRVASRCSSSCKSKIILDNISTSCNVMRECLKDNKEFEKYFREEEYETFHWPCERCLDILKNIKMFWKIVVEKVLKVHTAKSNTDLNSANSDVRSIVRGWKKDIIQEAKYVKSISVLAKENKLDLENSQINLNPNDEYLNCEYQNKSVETEFGVRSIASQKNSKSIRDKINKCISASFKMVDSIVDACHEKADDELLVCRNHMKDLQSQFETQRSEIERLEKENILLNIELQCIRENSLKQSLPSQELSLVRSIDNNSDEKFEIEPAKDIDSEMIITIKNCANETFRQISMLQVLHKTNGSIFNINESGTCCKNKDPINLLNKVYKTFGAIVRREITIANEAKESTTNDIEVKTTYHNIGLSKSAPSCSTTSLFISSDSNFESAKDT